MENLIISILIIALIVAMGMFIITWYYQEWSRKQSISEANYENRYSAIQRYVDDWPVNVRSFNAIFAELKRLGNMRYKNKEKTEVLTKQFLRKYTEESDEEFSVSQIDFKKAQKIIRVLNEVKAI
ncbi:MAG: hypothetical protein WC886_07500 [Saccharofermentanaceae bacterium]|jgi:hypothetical protein